MKQTILFVGGGTLGPVTPLLAVLRRMKERCNDLDFVWIGTSSGPEKTLVEAEGVVFFAIQEAKIPRYLSFKLLSWPLDYFRARLAAEKLVKKIRPSLVVSVGGFSSVPVMRAAKAMKIPCAIHQLDAEAGLANKAVASMCRLVSTSFKYDVQPFAGIISEQIATPSRFAGASIPSKTEAAHFFGLEVDAPIVFLVGGGTGAVALNNAVDHHLEKILKLAQVIHLTGKGKMGSEQKADGYVRREFFDEEQMLNAYAAADLVVSRAGMGAITDLIALKKPAILIPIPQSHQESNADKTGFVIVRQVEGFEDRLIDKIASLLNSEVQLRRLVDAGHSVIKVDDGSALAKRWLELL
ncbi:glycosyltransferase [Patescibacteria group bacterium]|nr:glycosyltransferase [Patescibacteria group bacterium]